MEGGTVLTRGYPRRLCAWLLTLSAAALLALAPPAAYAQNTAESKPPAEKPADKPAEKKADQKDEQADKKTDQDKPAEGGEKADADKPAEGAGNAADQPARVGPEPPAKQPSGVNGAESPAPSGQEMVGPLPPANPPVGPAPPPEPGKAAEQGPSILPEVPNLNLPGMPVVPGANAAEGRAAGAGAENLAEGGKAALQQVAVPPGQPFEHDSPDSFAGPSAGYVAPNISLNVPPLDQVPGRPPDTDFMQPGREYLNSRPLPPNDVTETDEERLARNVEESLKLISLPAEQRPAEGIKIPLPSGVVTFKAAQAFQFDRRNRKLTFTGDAEIVFNDIAIWADLIEIDDAAAMAYAKGYVAVQQRDDILYADEAYLNYDTQALELFYVEGNTGGPRLKGTLYFKAQRAYGSFEHLILEIAEITTCDPFCGSVDEVHMSAHKVHYRRGKSFIMHNVHAYVRSHKVAYIPTIAFPLPRQRVYEQGESDIKQNYGYNRTEGAFAKFAYTYSTRYVEDVQRALLGVVKLDVTQKRGAGLGLRQDFFIPGMGVTTLRGFYQQGYPWDRTKAADGTRGKPSTDFQFGLDQELNLSRYLTGSLSVDRTNRLTPSINPNQRGSRTNTWNSQFRLDYKKGNTNASLNASQRIDIRGGNLRTDNTTEPIRENIVNNANLTLSKNFTKELKFQLNDSYTSTKGASGRENLPADIEGTFSTKLQWQGARDTALDGYTADLSYLNQGIDFDRERNTTDNNIQIRKEMPSLEITLPRDLINDGAYFNTFKVSMENLVTGRRRSPEKSFRTYVSVGGRDRLEFSHSSSLDTSMNFEQFWYNDGNAQYVLQPRASYIYDTYRGFRFDAGWNLTFRQGVRNPPVQGDRRTYQQTANYGFTFTNQRSWRWRLAGGYNFVNWQHNPVTSNFTWDPNRVFGLTHTVSYNIETRRFTPERITAALRSSYTDEAGFPHWLLRATLDNDIEKNWRTTLLNLTFFKRYERGWSTEITGNYRDGTDTAPIDLTGEFLKEFIKKVAVRKVNCCTTLEAGWRTGINEVYFNVYLNALPQYPGTLDMHQPFDDNAQSQFFFPINQLQSDVMTDVFGINAQQFSGLTGF